MRIGVFSNTYKPIISGAVTSICQFRRGLRERGHEVFVYAPASRGYDDDEEGVFRYPAIDLPDTLNASLAVPFSPRVSHIISSLDLDIVHSHHPVIMGREAVRVARKLSVPLVFTCHSRYEDYSDYVPLGDLADPLVRGAIRLLVTNYVDECDLTICPACHVQSLLQGYGVTKPLQIIPTPVRLDSFGEGDGSWVREKHGIEPGTPVLLYAGRFAQEKELPFLLRAFHHVAESHPRCRLLLVGSGPEERVLRAQASELGVANRIVFAGFVEHVQMPDHLAAGDIFVFASRSEVQALAVVEGLAAGLPVVAVRTLATEELLNRGHVGVLTERDEQQFAAAVSRLIRCQEERHALGQRARDSAQRFSVQVCAGMLEQAYLALLRDFAPA
jgi:glycosyltransferase involved in cell wall biosynthesis